MSRTFDRRGFLALGGLAGAGVLVGCNRDRRAEQAGPASSTPSTTTTVATESTTAPTTSAPPERTAYWPPADDDRWERIAPADGGWDDGRLDASLDFAGERAARSVVVLADGRIVAERQWGVEPTWSRDIASAQKSVTATLVAIAEDRGLLATDAGVSAILGPSWSLEVDRDAEARITVLDLLTMVSGLDGALQVVAAPGTVWFYDNDAYHQLHRVLEAVTDRTLGELSEEWLFAPIGARRARWVERRGRIPGLGVDAAGRPLLGLRMDAYDLARFGLLVERNGRWQGTQVVSAAGIAAMLSPSSELNPGYGRLWWRNDGDAYRLPGPNPPRRDGALVPSAPDDLAAALGAGDQKAYVVPSWKTVVIRLGASAAGSNAAANEFDDEWWSRLRDARV